MKAGLLLFYSYLYKINKQIRETRKSTERCSFYFSDPQFRVGSPSSSRLCVFPGKMFQAGFTKSYSDIALEFQAWRPAAAGCLLVPAPHSHTDQMLARFQHTPSVTPPCFAHSLCSGIDGCKDRFVCTLEAHKVGTQPLVFGRQTKFNYTCKLSEGTEWRGGLLCNFPEKKEKDKKTGSVGGISKVCSPDVEI
ncbi:hypothetical protein XENOCAPTIV_003810 [Xenoophorus captivus]|uniref:Sushi domain-containing protein n=1 Tax=Xenoophorus captivus TaxID=1517983 RepID=A0ABV0QGA2_9TELE